MDCGIIAFGGDATSAFQQIRTMLKTAPDTHKMGRIVIVGGASITHGFAAGMWMLSARHAPDRDITMRIMNTGRIIRQCLFRGQHNAT